MKLRTLLALALTFVTSLAAATEQERTVDVFTWPLSAIKSSSLAKIRYNSTGATLDSYNTPKVPNSDDDIVRVGFYHPSGAWSGIATAASNFAEQKHKRLQLHLNNDGDVYHVGLLALDVGGSHGTTEGSAKDDLSVEVVRMRPGPTPHLNKPVVMSADGTAPEKEPEKSFLQKYVVFLLDRELIVWS